VTDPLEVINFGDNMVPDRDPRSLFYFSQHREIAVLRHLLALFIRWLIFTILGEMTRRQGNKSNIFQDKSGNQHLNPRSADQTLTFSELVLSEWSR